MYLIFKYIMQSSSSLEADQRACFFSPLSTFFLVVQTQYCVLLRPTFSCRTCDEQPLVLHSIQKPCVPEKKYLYTYSLRALESITLQRQLYVFPNPVQTHQYLVKEKKNTFYSSTKITLHSSVKTIFTLRQKMCLLLDKIIFYSPVIY